MCVCVCMIYIIYTRTHTNIPYMCRYTLYIGNYQEGCVMYNLLCNVYMFKIPKCQFNPDAPGTQLTPHHLELHGP